MPQCGRQRHKVETNRVANIASMAKDAFAHHEITVVHQDGLFRHWRCRRPDSGTYHFNITTVPWRLIVTGDVGDLIVEREEDMLPWARKAIDDVSYFFQKVPGCFIKKQYESDLAKAYCDELIADLREDHEDGWLEQVETVEHDLLSVVDDEHEFYRALYESDFYCGEMPELKAWTGNLLWCRESVKWFLEHTTEQ